MISADSVSPENEGGQGVSGAQRFVGGEKDIKKEIGKSHPCSFFLPSSASPGFGGGVPLGLGERFTLGLAFLLL